MTPACVVPRRRSLVYGAPMKSCLPWLLLGLVVGCGGPQESTGAARTPPPDYELHEWGVITTSASGTLVTAGPHIDEPQIAVEKPVLYFHAREPVSVQLEVLPGVGYEAREHYPPTHGLHWSMTIVPDGCAAAHAYPRQCAATDGICEVRELARYETRDAACLQVGDARLPLLFYRLGSAGAVSLPAAVQVQGTEVRAHATRGEVSGWRVAYVDGEVRAAPVTLGQTWHTLPTPDQPWTVAAESLNASLRAAGLTGAERGAFQRAWWLPLFGTEPVSAEATGAADEASEEALPDEDQLAEQHPRQELEQVEEERMLRPSAEVLDVMFYLLPAEEVDRISHLAATPAPNRVARAFLVRHVL